MYIEDYYGESHYTPDQLTGTVMDPLFDGTIDTSALVRDTIFQTWNKLSFRERLAVQELASNMPVGLHEKEKIAREVIYFTYVNDAAKAVTYTGSTALKSL